MGWLGKIDLERHASSFGIYYHLDLEGLRTRKRKTERESEKAKRKKKGTESASIWQRDG